MFLKCYQELYRQNALAPNKILGDNANNEVMKSEIEKSKNDKSDDTHTRFKRGTADQNYL